MPKKKKTPDITTKTITVTNDSTGNPLHSLNNSHGFFIFSERTCGREEKAELLSYGYDKDFFLHMLHAFGSTNTPENISDAFFHALSDFLDEVSSREETSDEPSISFHREKTPHHLN